VIDVVIVNWNAGEQLRECVSSLLTYAEQILGKIIVVDNGSSDQSVMMLPKHPLVELVLLKENVGFASGCNAGAAVSSSPYVLFLNPDAAVYQNTLQQAYDFMQNPVNQKVGILGVQLLDENGHVARSCSRFPSAARCFAQSVGLDKWRPATGSAMAEWDHLNNRVVDQVIGAFFLVRRPLFAQLQGFDERFFVYYEEVDFAYRAAQAGYRSYYLADTSAFHLGGGVSNQVKAKRLFYTLRSRVLFASKHFSKPAALLVLLSVMSVEPLMRFAQAAIRLSAAGLRETFAGFSLFYQWLPAWWFRGETRN
jgi:GT2 family glycosyltransferase